MRAYTVWAADELLVRSTNGSTLSKGGLTDDSDYFYEENDQYLVIKTETPVRIFNNTDVETTDAYVSVLANWKAVALTLQALRIDASAVTGSNSALHIDGAASGTITMDGVSRLIESADAQGALKLSSGSGTTVLGGSGGLVLGTEDSDYGFDLGQTLKITGGTITSNAASLAPTSATLVITGGSVKGEVGTGARPENENGEKLYLFVVSNPDGEVVKFDNVTYQGVNHTLVDPADTNLYAWVPGKDCTLTVGEISYAYRFVNGRFVRDRHFVVTSDETIVEGTDYTYSDDGVLTILTNKAMTISMREGVESTNNTIAVAKDVDANITLNGVNIDVVQTGAYVNFDWVDGLAAFYIADNSKGNVTVTLADGTTNILRSGANRAALEKNGNGDDIGRLTIQGTGTLKLESYADGAGIGGRARGDTRNIVIKNGTITGFYATFYSQGAFIGGGMGGNGIDITVDGGTIFGGIQNYNMGAVIGGGGRVDTKTAGGDGRGITVNGGTITVTACYGESAIIGGGDGGVGEDITVNGGTITVKDRQYNGAVIGGGKYGEGRNIRVTGGKLSFELKASGAGIGGGGGAQGKNISVTGGTISITAGEYTSGAGIGGGSAQSESVVITGGSILIARPDGWGQTIGSGYQADPTCPTNGAATPKNVYAITIPNPDGKDIYIDGVKWTPSNHTALDASDTNLYAYITGEKHVIKIGDDEAVWHFDSATKAFLKTDCVDHGKDHYCDYCGDKLSDHTGGQATCTQKAVCTYCGQPYGDEPSHNYVPCKAKAATCTEKGWNAHEVCSVCGDKKGYQELPALGHDEQPHDAEAATCTEKGWNAYVTCSRCDYTTYKETPTLGHDEQPHDAKAATCTEKGWNAYVTCSRCDYTTYKEIPALGHKYKDTVIAPTCTEMGCTEHVCANCGDRYVNSLTAMVEHSYANGVCTVCGAKAPTAPVCPAGHLTDLPYKWYREAIDFAVAQGLMVGMSKTTFEPETTMTRAMVVTVLYRLSGSPAVAEASTFVDVPTGLWYSDAVAWAQDSGVVNGTSPTTFDPDEPVTREQLATILWRYEDNERRQDSRSIDLGKQGVSAYALEAMQWAVAKELYRGDEHGNLNPTAGITRAEFATVLMRYLGGSYQCPIGH